MSRSRWLLLNCGTTGWAFDGQFFCPVQTLLYFGGVVFRTDSGANFDNDIFQRNTDIECDGTLRTFSYFGQQWFGNDAQSYILPSCSCECCTQRLSTHAM